MFCTHIVFSIGVVDLVVMVQWDHLVVLKCSMTWATVDMDVNMMEEWKSK